MAKAANYIGLMSGTSMDGVDAVITTEDCKALVASVYLPYPASLKTQLRTLVQQGKTSLKLLTELDIQVAQIFAHATQTLLAKARLSREDIVAIGSHGKPFSTKAAFILGRLVMAC